ncbi:helix-turn-helix domain-containing protein [Actinocatenispora sera]|jgi:excisionase family DNA binding protein|uniref:Helix-turn-helix domain-containing protein n=1 Tax=Actinocatenispora sera TaxID=390989 RepID=A0A810L283_9ACTN|nr:helix-turn-helix domain-containing protein [Actinocatenispora sera]BCJ28288.1 hypothetical protein Asera_23960 [Actinocatenispora sera]
MQDQRSDELATGTVPAVRPYRVKQVAELLDVHPATVYRAIESGRLAALRVGAGRGGLRITRQAFEAFLAAIATSVEGEVA